MTAGAPGTGAPAAGACRWPAAVAAALSLALVVWMGLGWDALTQPSTYRGKKVDYYSLLVHGFLSGHLYMDIAADPRLESPDPAVRAAAPVPLDSSYFNRHFYLYFGVTPAAAVLLPYAWLTGGDLDPRVLVVLAVMAGFLLSLCTWAMAARDHFPRMGPVLQTASVAALACATATPLLLARAMFYEVPIAAGYACVMAACLWIYRALSGRGSARWQLAWASLSLGLAVGCRPDLALALPALAAAAILCAVRGRGGRALLPEILRNGAASALPAACVGAGLALYNLERFGSPLDFGFSYGMNQFMSSHARLASAAYVWPNLHWYYLTPPALSPYFPYVFPSRADFGPKGYETGENIHGQFPFLVLAAFVAVSAALVGRRLRLGGLAAYLGLLAFMSVSVFMLLVPLGIRGDRYMVDFQAPLALGVVLLAGSVSSGPGGLASRAWDAAFAALALLAAAFSVFAGLQLFDCFKNLRTSTFEKLQHLGNMPSALIARAGLLPYGPLEIKVAFPQPEAKATFEPLLSLGTPRYNDSIYVVQLPSNQVQLLADHYGILGQRSGLIPITPGRAYTLRVDMGAFYPPLDHPFFSRYGPVQAHRMKAEVHVELDGKRVLDAPLGSYDAPPWTLELGRNDIALSGARTAFAGKILGASRLAPRAPAVDAGSNGLWRLRCVFPMQIVGRNYPLLSSGVTGRGTLLFVSVLAAGRIQFGVDEWGVGAGSSEPITVEPEAEHTVEVFIGTLAGNTQWPAAWHVGSGELEASANRLQVWLDGKLALSRVLQVPLDPMAGLIDVGTNLQGFSTSSPGYEGPISAAPFSQEELREFLERNLRLRH
jgi:hypothetical protein